MNHHRLEPAADSPTTATNFFVGQLCKMPTATKEMIEILADRAANVIKVHEQQESVQASNVPPLIDFVSSVLERSEVRPAVLFLATLYLDRLRQRLPSTARGLPCTRHRVFVSALIVAYKYLNDISIKNKNWARISKVFSLDEINLMERQFLDLLNFELNFGESDIRLYASHLKYTFTSPPPHFMILDQQSPIVDKLNADPLSIASMPALDDVRSQISSDDSLSGSPPFLLNHSHQSSISSLEEIVNPPL